MATQLRKLFDPIRVGQVELKNRIVMLPSTTNYATEGRMNQGISDYYVERARGGAGLICFGLMPPVSYVGAHLVGSRIDKDEHIPELRELTKVIHAQGAKVLGQVCLRYAWRKSEDSPLETVGPSAGIVTGPGINPPRELTIEEIGQIVEQYAEAARRVREAGFDIVEFHSGLGYMINRFISPATNKRTDKYGGSLENRMRFLLEILQRSREKAGDDYTYGCRISAEEFIGDGHTIRESKQVAQILEKAGIDCLNVQAGWLECSKPLIQNSVPQGAYAYLAEEIKKVVDIPVVAAQRIVDPFLADQILVQEKADLVGMCRALIADPHLPNKAKEGRFNDICSCIACCECLDSQIVRLEPMGCSVNPWVGKESEGQVKAVAQPKRVFVIGGGPAGMKAAIVASQRGHKVTLFEKGETLSGQLLPATEPPYKEELASFRDYLIRQVQKEGVEIILNTEVTPELVINGKPDAVVVSTGAIHIVLDIPGTEGDNVATAVDVLMGDKEVGRDVVIIGGGLIGSEAAEFLAEKGKQVTILEMLPRFGQDIGPSSRWVVRRRLGKAGVKLETGAKVVEITERGARVARDDSSEFFEADTVVVAAGMRPRNELAQALEGKVPRLYAIGDCAKIGKIRQAIEDGARIGMEL